MTEPITSPCVNICKIDPATGWCLGCKRNLDEIANWSSYTEAQRRGVMETLAQRTLDDAALREVV